MFSIFMRLKKLNGRKINTRLHIAKLQETWCTDPHTQPGACSIFDSGQHRWYFWSSLFQFWPVSVCLRVRVHTLSVHWWRNFVGLSENCLLIVGWQGFFCYPSHSSPSPSGQSVPNTMAQTMTIHRNCKSELTSRSGGPSPGQNGEDFKLNLNKQKMILTGTKLFK